MILGISEPLTTKTTVMATVASTSTNTKTVVTLLKPAVHHVDLSECSTAGELAKAISEIEPDLLEKPHGYGMYRHLRTDLLYTAHVNGEDLPLNGPGYNPLAPFSVADCADLSISAKPGAEIVLMVDLKWPYPSVPGSHEISLRTTDTVGVLKQRIAGDFRVDASHLQIEFGGINSQEITTDEMQLFHCGVEDHALVVVRREAEIKFLIHGKMAKPKAAMVSCMLDDSLDDILHEFALELEMDIACLRFMLRKNSGMRDESGRKWLQDQFQLFEAESAQGTVGGNGLRHGDEISVYRQLLRKREDGDGDRNDSVSAKRRRQSTSSDH